DFPSGIHPTLVPEALTLRSLPPDCGTMKTPCPSRTNAISVPSGDHAGAVSRNCGVSISLRMAPPLTAATQISVGPLLSGPLDAKATKFPSGDIVGAPF